MVFLLIMSASTGVSAEGVVGGIRWVWGAGVVSRRGVVVLRALRGAVAGGGAAAQPTPGPSAARGGGATVVARGRHARRQRAAALRRVRGVRRAVRRGRSRGVVDRVVVADDNCEYRSGQDKGDSTSLQRECSARARSGKSIHASRPFREMIARPKISRNEWKTAERGAFEVGNFAAQA